MKIITRVDVQDDTGLLPTTHRLALVRIANASVVNEVKVVDEDLVVEEGDTFSYMSVTSRMVFHELFSSPTPWGASERLINWSGELGDILDVHKEVVLQHA